MFTHSLLLEEPLAKWLVSQNKITCTNCTRPMSYISSWPYIKDCLSQGCLTMRIISLWIVLKWGLSLQGGLTMRIISPRMVL